MKRVIYSNTATDVSFDTVCDILENKFDWSGAGLDNLEYYCDGDTAPESIADGIFKCFLEEGDGIDSSWKNTVYDICKAIYGDPCKEDVDIAYDWCCEDAYEDE